MIRLVASDVDGTLLDHHGTLPPDRAAAARRMVAAGLPLVLATGKLWTSVAPLVAELGLPGPHVACNGSVVFAADGTVLSRTLLADEVADEVIRALRTHRTVHAVYLEDGTIVTDHIDAAHDVLPLLGEPLPVVEGRGGRGVIKVLAILPEEAEGSLRDVAFDAAHVQRTGPRFLEWNAPGADKATGLLEVVERLARTIVDLTIDEVMAVGDAENDVPMLRAAGVGVAVRDAAPAAIDAADRVLSGDLAELLDTLATDARAAA